MVRRLPLAPRPVPGQLGRPAAGRRAARAGRGRRSPGCAWSRASARRRANWPTSSGAPCGCSPRACGSCGCRPSTARRWRRSPRSGQVGVLLLGGWLALHGHITLGTFLAFSTYLGQLVSPVRQLTALLTIGQQARAGVERVLDVVDARARHLRCPRRGRPAGRAAGDRTRSRHLRLPRSRPVLSDVSLSVEPGETLAIVGGAGSGKSTIALLLPRFYDAQDGTVRIGGVDVRDATAGLAALAPRRGVRRQLPVLRLDPRQHRLRPSGRDPRAGDRGRAGGRGRRVHQRAARGLRHRRRRARADPVGRAAAAHRAGPGAAARTRACWCSTTRPRRSTRGSRPRSTRPCAR